MARRVGIGVVVVLSALVTLTAVGWVALLARLGTPQPQAMPDEAEVLQPALGPGQQPAGPVEPAAPAQVPIGADDAWLDRISSAALIPKRALDAYAAAELRTRQDDPACELSWATLAGIGFIESQHGTYGGNALGEDGRPLNGPIVGVALDGQGPVAAIDDTDGGALDGDTEWDRAVGPLQFIPRTWQRWGADGDGDGTADPQDIDDAAYAAGRYLCDHGSPMSDADEWRQAVLAYNASDEYARNVVLATNFYAARSTAS